MVNSKRYTGIDQYRNISFHLSNWYNLRYETDSFGSSQILKTKKLVQETNEEKWFIKSQ